MGAGREAQRVVRSAEELLGTGGHPADPAHLPGRELGVAADALEAGGGVTPGLDLAGLQHLLAQRGTALGRGGGVKLIEGDGVHLDAEVDAVEQRAGYPAAVLPHRAGRAGAGAGGVAVVAALAGVHGGYQLEPAGVGGAASGAADRDLAVFQRLAEHFEALAGKLRQLVQKQDAAVSQTALAGAEIGPAASQRSGTGRVVRAAEGPMGDEPAPFGQLPGDGVDLGRLYGLFTAERRQDAGQTPGQHGLAGAGCADQKHVVPACGGNDHGPAGEGLAHDVCKVRGIVPALGGVEGDGHRGGNGGEAAQRVHHLPRGAGRVDLHRVAARLGCFGGVLGGDVQGPDAVGGSGQRHGQHTGHRAERTVQRQFAEEGGILRRGFQLAGGGQHRQQQGQVVDWPGLADIGRGQVDRDVPVRPLEAQILDGGTDAVAALADGGIRQAHQRKCGQPAGGVGFDGHSKAGQAIQAVTSQNRVHKILLREPPNDGKLPFFGKETAKKSSELEFRQIIILIFIIVWGIDNVNV